MNWIVRNFVISTLLAFGVFSFIFFSETGELPKVSDQWEGFLLAIFLANLGGIALIRLNASFNEVFPWNKRRAMRFVVEMITGLITFSLLALIFYFAYIYPSISINEESSFWNILGDGIVKFGIILFVLLYMASMVNFSMFSYNQYAVVQIETLSVEREQLNLQFEALKSQLNPHFLFNSLNTISSLAYRDVATAEDYIRKLADSYQYILDTNDHNLVTVRKEMAMVRSFFFMQMIKYMDCIRMEEHITDACMDTFIPPLTLQMLVENALKHNLICEDKELVIEISCTDESIVVKNNIISKPVLLRVGNDVIDRPKENDSYKIGLENIKKRYKYFVNKDVQINRNAYFTVVLPLIKTKVEGKGIL